MAWNEAVITNRGLNLLAKALSQGEIVITSAIGGEEYTDTTGLLAMTEIKGNVHYFNIAKIEKENGKITVNIRVQNAELLNGYKLRQIGLVAKLEDETNEVLFAIIQDNEGEAIPSYKENPEFLVEFDFVIPVSNTENININILPGIFVTFDDLEVFENEQAPSYNESNELVELTSGEKLTIAFGKLAKAVKALIEHLKDKVKHITSEERTAWNGKAAGNHTHSVATQSAAGLMSAADKKKLDGVAAGANSYTHPVTSGNKHIPSGGASGQILRWSADGTAVWGNDNNTTYNAATQSANGLMSAADKKKLDGVAASANNYSLPLATASVRGGAKIGYTANGKNYPVQLSNEQMFVNVPWTDTNTTYSNMTGASASAAGKAGLVPAPAKGNQAKYLRGDGTWQTPPDTNTTYSIATQSANGLMSAADKTKLDGVAANANKYTHPAYTARTGVPTANQTPAFGGTFSVSQPVSDASGHITALNARTVKIPNSAASQSAAGLMSAADKKKLDGVTLTSPVCMTASMGAAISFAVPAGAKAAIVSLRTVDTSTNSSYGRNTVKDTYVDVIDVTAGEVSIRLWFNDEYHRVYGAFSRSNGNADHGIISLKDNIISFATGVYPDNCNDIPTDRSSYSSTFSVIFI